MLTPPQEVIILLPAPVTEMPVCCCVLVWSDGLQLRLNRRAAPVFWACCCSGGADGRMDGRTSVWRKKKKISVCSPPPAGPQVRSKALFVIFRGYSESCRNLCEICSACCVTGWCESVHQCQPPPPPQPQPRNLQSHSAAPALRGRRLAVLVQGVSKIFYKCVDPLFFGSL